MTQSQPTPTTHGALVAAAHLGAFYYTEARYAAHATVPAHEHMRSGWTLTLDGTYTERFRGESYDAPLGAVLGKPAHARHSDRYGPAGAHCFLIGVDLAHAALHPGVGRALAEISFQRRGPVPVVLQRIYREFVAREYAWRLAVEGLSLELCAAVARLSEGGPTYRAPRWLERVRDQLHAALRHPPSFSTLAAAADVHPVHLSRAFRRAYGVTPGTYLRQLRIERAKELLAAPHLSLARIAAAAGFCDQSHLTRVFRRATGVTPARYRRQAG